MTDVTTADKKKVWFAWRAQHSGLAAAAAVLAFLTASSPVANDARSLAALTISVGMLFGVAHAYRMRALLFTLVVGLAISLFSSVDFLRYDVDGKYLAVSSTLAVFMLLALTLGGFAECVRFVHGLTHIGRHAAGKSVPK